MEAPGEWIETLLRRSGEAGLIVDTQPAGLLYWMVEGAVEQDLPFNWRSLALLQAIYPHWKRIEEAKIAIGAGHPHLEHVEAPILRAFEITLAVPDNDETEYALFRDSGTPSLKELKLATYRCS